MEQAFNYAKKSLPAEKERGDAFPAGLDHFKFRIQELKGAHHFTGVSFDDPGLDDAARRRIADYFEGRKLEDITAHELSMELAGYPDLPRLMALIDELQELLCN